VMKWAILLVTMILAAPAEARVVYNYDNDGRTFASASARHDRVRHARTTVAQHARNHSLPAGRFRASAAAQIPVGRQAQVIGGRPAGCPHRYCGCGASIKVFGRIRPELNLAANWIRKFPRSIAAPGMAAARSGHVMVLMEHVSGDNWKVWDANSGGGLTRIHVRSIRGYVVVNPLAQSVALRM
jgi:hypothetical protein